MKICSDSPVIPCIRGILSVATSECSEKKELNHPNIIIIYADDLGYGDVIGLDPEDPIKVSYTEPILTESTGKDHPELLRMHPSHGHDMTISFIERNRNNPFILYFATHYIYVPRVPHPRFTGKSGMGPRGDAIVEFDEHKPAGRLRGGKYSVRNSIHKQI